MPIYLNRGGLWVAKFRANTMKECLLQMLEWYGATDPGPPRYTWYIGHHMDEWLPADLWRRVHETFGRSSMPTTPGERWMPRSTCSPRSPRRSPPGSASPGAANSSTACDGCSRSTGRTPERGGEPQ